MKTYGMALSCRVVDSVIWSVMSEFSLQREERLRGDKVVSALFTEGRTGFVFPFKYYYMETDAVEDDPQISMLVSVPKRMFKRAVKRNLLKRRTREAYRLEKHSILDTYAGNGKKLHIAFVYSSREEAGFDRVRKSMKRMLSAVEKELRPEDIG